VIAGAIKLATGTYQHINVRFNSPRWWRFLFTTTEHHSLHHSQDYELPKQLRRELHFHRPHFGTCVDGELSCSHGRRSPHVDSRADDLSLTEGWKALKERFGRPSAVPAQ